MKRSYWSRYWSTGRRLRHWDYGSDGAYFITICTKNRLPAFGKVSGGAVELSPLGIAAHACWTAISDHFPFVVADTFVAMPDHVHGIIIIDNAGQYRATSNLSDLPWGLPWNSAGNRDAGVDRVDGDAGVDRAAIPRRRHGHPAPTNSAPNRGTWHLSYADTKSALHCSPDTTTSRLHGRPGTTTALFATR